MQSVFERTGADFSRFNYLGEWHSHPPFPVDPSFEDIEIMTDMVQNSTAGISFALLLIVRLRSFLWSEYSMTSFARGYNPETRATRSQVHLKLLAQRLVSRDPMGQLPIFHDADRAAVP